MLGYDRKTITQCKREHLNNLLLCSFEGKCIHQSILEKGKKYCLQYTTIAESFEQEKK
jgi:hypothetical protein